VPNLGSPPSIGSISIGSSPARNRRRSISSSSVVRQPWAAGLRWGLRRFAFEATFKAAFEAAWVRGVVGLGTAAFLTTIRDRAVVPGAEIALRRPSQQIARFWIAQKNLGGGISKLKGI